MAPSLPATGIATAPIAKAPGRGAGATGLEPATSGVTGPHRPSTSCETGSVSAGAGQSSAAITPGRVRLQMIQMSIAITRIDQNG